MSGNRRTMIAQAFGRDFEYKTAGSYSVAAVVRYWADTEDGPRLVHRVAAVGNSRKSAETRGKRALRLAGAPGYDGNIEVVSLTEQTSPLLHRWFGSRVFTVRQGFRPGEGWVTLNHHPGASLLRRLHREGYTAIACAKGSGAPADFQMTEVIRSLNARKAA